jgi:hypothetical protein
MRDQLKEAFIEAFDSGDAETAATIVFDCLQAQMDGGKSLEVIEASKKDEGDDKKGKSGWAKLVVYKDKEGREIAAFEPTGGKDKRVILRGVVTLTMQVQMHPGLPPQPQQQRYEFPFKKGTSIRHAMEIFDKTAEEAVENLKKEQEEKKNQIVAARGNLPPMIGPDGKPIQMGKPRK